MPDTGLKGIHRKSVRRSLEKRLSGGSETRDIFLIQQKFIEQILYATVRTVLEL